MHELQEIIAIIPCEEYEMYIERVKEVIPDLDDTMYLALALQRNCAVWSNDARLKEQNLVTVYNTPELLEQLQK